MLIEVIVIVFNYHHYYHTITLSCPEIRHILFLPHNQIIDFHQHTNQPCLIPEDYPPRHSDMSIVNIEA